jgi:hypothetical protein
LSIGKLFPADIENPIFPVKTSKDRQELRPKADLHKKKGGKGSELRNGAIGGGDEFAACSFLVWRSAPSSIKSVAE